MNIGVALLGHEGCSRFCPDCIWDSRPSQRSTDVELLSDFCDALGEYAKDNNGVIDEVAVYGIGEALEWSELPEAFEVVLNTLLPLNMHITTSGVASHAEAERLRNCLSASKALLDMTVPLHMSFKPAQAPLDRLRKTLAVEEVELVELTLRFDQNPKPKDMIEALDLLHPVLAAAGFSPKMFPVQVGSPEFLTDISRANQPWSWFNPRLIPFSAYGKELYSSGKDRIVVIRPVQKEAGGRSQDGSWYSFICQPWQNDDMSLAIFPDNTVGHCFGCLGNGRYSLKDRDFDLMFADFREFRRIAAKRFWDHRTTTKHACIQCAKRWQICNALC